MKTPSFTRERENPDHQAICVIRKRQISPLITADCTDKKILWIFLSAFISGKIWVSDHGDHARYGDDGDPFTQS
jgi:hypothetical protein